MTTDLRTSIGTDDDQTKLVFKAKQIISLVDAIDGMIVRISSKEYGIIKNGILVNVTADDVPETFKRAFDAFEKINNPPKYPYTLEIKEGK